MNPYQSPSDVPQEIVQAEIVRSPTVPIIRRMLLWQATGVVLFVVAVASGRVSHLELMATAALLILPACVAAVRILLIRR